MRTYQEYHDSGVEWLGQVPAHWEVRRLRFVAGLNPTRGEVAGLSSDTEVSFVPMEAVGERGELDSSATRELGAVTTGYTYFADGDVVLAKITPCFENGKGALATGLTNGIAFGTTELHVVRPGEGADARFIYYLTQSHPFRDVGEGHMYGAGGQKRVPESFVKDFRAAWPPMAEQSAIANFLDRRTSEIDALIAAKEGLLTLLDRKRQAAISTAVTRGLSPDIPMRDSGIEWLGRVPAHWAVKRLKFIVPAITVGIVVTPAKYYEDEGVPCLRSLNVKPGRLSQDDLVYISDESNELHSKSILHKGDVVAVRTGKPGTAAVVDEFFDGGNAIDLIIIRRSTEVDGRFLCHALNSSMAHAQYEMGAEGALQQHFNIETAKNLLIPEPPLDEQQRIADFLDARLADVDAVRDAIGTQLERLRIQRQALITAAVTGRVDVRATGEATA